MTLCLYECLRDAGLQHHYARFTSMGVRHAAQLSALTMEDYPLLGIRSMEDRTRLFHLVQMVKTLDLEGHRYGDDYDDCDCDYEVDGDYEDATDAGGFTYSGDDVNVMGEDRGHEEDAYDDEMEAATRLNAASSSRPPPVRRRLDFSHETVDPQQKHFNSPINSVILYASQNPGGNHRPGIHHGKYDHHTEANSKLDITRQLSVCKSQKFQTSPKHGSIHEQNSRHTTAVSKYSKKPVGYKDRMAVSRTVKPHTGIQNHGICKHAVKPTPVYKSKRAAGYNYGLPLSSPPAPNKRQTGKQRISVCVRKRPLTRAENRRGEADVVTTQGGECVIVHESKEAVDLTQYILQHRFYFDQVFGEESSNKDVYEKTAYPLVQHMLNGGQATCFAYGQTGAGKTHTMLGLPPGKPGLYALAAQDIFAHLSATHTPSPLLVYVSFFEIYCGQLYDLLDHRKRLFAREDGQRVVHITGLSEVRVDSVSSLLEVISWGTEERTQGVSGVNPLSSRSHALLQIQLRSPQQQLAGRMWFVDLAGSERAADTREPDRQSRMEGAEINQSLLALKECIRSLDQEQSHTPFRQSKLTQVLKDSFVGNSKTCMIANISPGDLASEHTLNTLRYADRVKELRGQGGVRGGRRAKTAPSPKRNQSSSSSGSSISTRGKSPPKRPKLGRQREAACLTTPTGRVPILCSTPKDREEERGRGLREEEFKIKLITPVGGSLGMDDKRLRRAGAVKTEGRGKEDEEGYDTSHTDGDQNTRARLVVRQPTEEQIHSCVMTREGLAHAVKLSSAGFGHREKEQRQTTCKRESDKRRWREQRQQVDRSRETDNELRRTEERSLQRVGERDEERKRHLRWYHQKLQQFLPSSAPPSVHLLPSPSVCRSFSSSNQPSLSPFASSSSCPLPPSLSSFICHGLQEVLDAYRARAEVRANVRDSETSESYSKNNDEDDHGDTGGVGDEWRVPREETETRGGADRGKSERRRPLGAAGEREGRGRSEEWRLNGMEAGQRKWAWVAETEGTNRMVSPVLIQREANVFSNHGSEERWRLGEEGGEVLDDSDIPVGGEWSTEPEGVDNYGLMSTLNSNSENCSLFDRLQVLHPPFDQPHQQAPAERPFSPVCDHTDTLSSPVKLNDLSLESKDTNSLPLPLQNVSPVHSSQAVPSSRGERREIPNALSAAPTLTTLFTQTRDKLSAKTLSRYPGDLDTISSFASLPLTQVHNHSEVNANTSVLPPEHSSADSVSCTMDPLSVSLLQVDLQAATSSFLQGEESVTSHCRFEKERADSNRREVKKENLLYAEMMGKEDDGDCCLSLLDLVEVKPHCASISKTTMSNDHIERTQDMYGGAYHLCNIDITTPPIPVDTLVSLPQGNSQKPQAQPRSEVLGNQNPASPLRASSHLPSQTPVTESTSHSAQCLGYAVPRRSHSLIPDLPMQTLPQNADNTHDKPASFISTRQTRSDLGQLNAAPSQSDSAGLNHPYDSHSSLKLFSSTGSKSPESTGKQHNRPTIHLSTVEDVDHDQWRVVQAHWEQLQEMDALYIKEGTLLCQQPDMSFGEYVRRLEEIMERKAQCVQSMRSQLQPYLKPSPSYHQHRHREANNSPTT